MATKVKVKQSATRKGRTSTSRISSKNQVTVPVDILREIGLSAGDNVAFKVVDKKIVVEKETDPFMAFIGCGAGIFDDFDLEKERADAWRE